MNVWNKGVEGIVGVGGMTGVGEVVCKTTGRFGRNGMDLWEECTASGVWTTSGRSSSFSFYHPWANKKPKLLLNPVVTVTEGLVRDSVIHVETFLVMENSHDFPVLGNPVMIPSSRAPVKTPSPPIPAMTSTVQNPPPVSVPVLLTVHNPTSTHFPLTLPAPLSTPKNPHSYAQTAASPPVSLKDLAQNVIGSMDNFFLRSNTADTTNHGVRDDWECVVRKGDRAEENFL